MREVFIVRKFVAQEGGARHVYEEEVFDSYLSAKRFVSIISEEEDDFFLSEIVTCVLNNENIDKEKKKEFFDFKGNPLCSVSQSRNMNDSGDGFILGDIVKILPYPWNSNSPTYVETIGVIASMSTNSSKRDGSVEISNEHKLEYVVDCIRDGYLGHWHVNESAIEKHTGNLPKNLTFLNLLSKHYKKIEIIPEGIIRAAYVGELFVENVEHYKF